jgi:hypothetical protein
MSGLADAFMGVRAPKENPDGLSRVADLLSRQEAARGWQNSVMSQPTGQGWIPDYERAGGQALEAPMVSPEDLIGTGLISKSTTVLGKALPALVAAINPLAKKRYDAKMPLFLDEDGNMSVMTIIPKGLP